MTDKKMETHYEDIDCNLQTLIKVKHEKLRKTLNSALCWLKNYRSILMMTLINEKIIIDVELPDFIGAIAMNLLEECNHEDNVPSFYYINLEKNGCEKLVRKTFKRIAFYTYNSEKFNLKPYHILPLSITQDCIDYNKVYKKIAQLDGFCRLFDEIINISSGYNN